MPTPFDIGAGPTRNGDFPKRQDVFVLVAFYANLDNFESNTGIIKTQTIFDSEMNSVTIPPLSKREDIQRPPKATMVCMEMSKLFS